LRRDLWRVPAGFPPSLAMNLHAIERWFWVALHLFGLGFLAARKRFEELLLLLLPLTCVVVLNALGQWPIGAFRTNLFLCVYSLPIAAIAVDAIAVNSALRRWLLAGALALLTVIPGFAFGFDWHQRKHTWTRNHEEREVLKYLREQREEHLRRDPRRKPEALLLDPQTFESQNFYLELHPETRDQRAFFKKNFKQENLWGFDKRMQRDLKKKLAANPMPIWLVISKPQSMIVVKNLVQKEARILVEHRIGEDHLILLVHERKEAPSDGS
jgi:hypothetical protein